MSKIRVLIIAPYEGLGSLCKTVVNKHSRITSDTKVLALDEAIGYIKMIDITAYDFIVSRGVTGEMLEKVSPIPVINIETSGTDILRAIQLAENTLSQYAFVGYKDLVAHIKTYCVLLQINPDIYIIENPEHASNIITKIKEEGCRFIIGDGIAVDIAKSLGMGNILITSGPESINAAFRICESIYDATRKVRSLYEFLKITVESSEMQIAVFDEDGAIAYSNISTENEPVPQYIDKIKKKIPGVFRNEVKRFYLNNQEYRHLISTRLLDISGNKFAAFYHDPHQTKLHMNKEHFKVEEFDQTRLNMIMAQYNSSDRMLTILDNIKNMYNSALPIMIQGECGTGKDTLAYTIYASSSYRNKSLITIDCDSVSEQDWKYLLDSESSPLFENNNTIYISNISAMTMPSQQKLYNHFQQTSLASRNKIITSCDGNLVNLIKSNKLLFELYKVLNGIVVNIPPIRERADELPSIVACYINEVNQLMPTQVIGFETEAMELMQKYQWPLNIDQLKQVVREVVVSTSTSFVTADQVRSVLSQSDFTDMRAAEEQSINLNNNLVEITKDVISAVLKEENMNQSKAAKRLGISRSTMWRKLKE